MPMRCMRQNKLSRAMTVAGREGAGLPAARGRCATARPPPGEALPISLARRRDATSISMLCVVLRWRPRAPLMLAAPGGRAGGWAPCDGDVSVAVPGRRVPPRYRYMEYTADRDRSRRGETERRRSCTGRTCKSKCNPAVVNYRASRVSVYPVSVPVQPYETGRIRPIIMHNNFVFLFRIGFPAGAGRARGREGHLAPRSRGARPAGARRSAAGAGARPHGTRASTYRRGCAAPRCVGLAGGLCVCPTHTHTPPPPALSPVDPYLGVPASAISRM